MYMQFLLLLLLHELVCKCEYLSVTKKKKKIEEKINNTIFAMGRGMKLSFKFYKKIRNTNKIIVVNGKRRNQFLFLSNQTHG